MSPSGKNLSRTICGQKIGEINLEDDLERKNKNKMFIKNLNFSFQWSPRGPSERGQVHPVRSRSPGPRQGRDELHAADEVHVQQPHRGLRQRASLEAAARQLTSS